MRHSPSGRGREGFALLVTITLVAFLVMVLVSVAALTRIETRVAANDQHLHQARQNALMALNLAIGQLQKTAGPDQRVTARADIIAPPGLSWSGNADPAAARAIDTAAIDAHWQATGRNRHWTGVWRNANDDPADYDPNAPAAFNPVPGLESWLVSGNENSPAGDTFTPDTVVTSLTPASTPLDRLTDADGQPHRLLLKTAAGVTDAASLDRAVTAPEIPITAPIAGYAGPQTVGHYAWWVGDEGVKARANLVDPFVFGPDAESSAAQAQREITRRRSAQRHSIEAMTASGTDGLAALDPAAQPDRTERLRFETQLRHVLSPSQLLYLDEIPPTLDDELKTRFHDVSLTSRGVLSDTKNGGLKRDLTYLLGQPDLASLRTALNAAYGTPVAPSATSNRIFTPATTLYATFPANESASRPYDESDPTRPGIFAYGATWEQLWSFHNIGNLTSATPAGGHNSSGQAVPRLQTETQHGITPLIMQCKIYYRLRFEGGEIFVDTIPVAVLANPHAVPLAPADYQLRISGTRPNLVFGSTDNTSAPSTEFFTAANWPGFSYSEPGSYTGNITFVLRSTGMAAGEAQIFTIDPDPVANPTIDAEDRIRVVSAADAKWVVMKNDFDPVPALTYNTGKSIPTTAYSSDPAAPIEQRTVPTRAALRSGAPQINSRLYIDYVAAEGDRRLVQFIRGQQYTSDLGLSGSEQRFLVVDPIPAGGLRQGGGYNLVLNQPPTSTTAAATANLVPQQAPFYQVNYRGLLVFFGGSDSTGFQHTLEWARTFAKNGSTGSAGNTPNPWLGANLLRPAGSTTHTRWGIVNLGEGQNQTVPPASIGGASASEVGFINYLYDLPRPGLPLTSLGQLQHFNPAGFIPATNFDSGNHRPPSVVNSWQITYPISNSYPHPRVSRDRVFDYKAEHGYHFDGSYLWNDLLWDRFYFSTFPPSAPFDFADDTLANPRYRPFRDRATVAWDDETNFRGDGNPATAANSRRAAENLLVDGAFNINSTSVEAWKAVFSSLKHVPHGNDPAPAAPFSRTAAPAPDRNATDAQTGISPNSWAGFRDLDRDDIQNLAEEMVMQLRKRGPFLSLSEFVNRRLIPGRSSNAATSADPLRLGLSGALQSAIDRMTNRQSDIAAPFNVPAKAFVSLTTNNTNHNATRDPDYRMSTGLAGFPGYLLQADILSALGPALSARSDTFTIRTYGDSVNPALGATDPAYVTARAWCEAVVQRLPDYVDATAATDTPVAGSDAETFGRRFAVVSFRWLSPEDV